MKIDSTGQTTEITSGSGAAASRSYCVRWAVLGTVALVASLGCGEIGAGEAGDGQNPSAEATSGGLRSVENPDTVLRAATLTALEVAALDDSVRTPIPNPNRNSVSGSGSWAAQDWQVFRQKARWAEAQRLDTLEMGAAVARMAGTFVGWTYTPQTLEVAGPERVVVNLAELDCVTFIENVLALVRFQGRYGSVDAVDPEVARAHYEGLLEEIRYREGALVGYTSRLHYFSEWLTNNQARSLVALRTAELGGVVDAEPIDFMSTHPSAYPALAESTEAVAAIRDVENRLNALPRLYIPEALVGQIAPRIREGDLIAATSTVNGLDIAHTGIAILVDGELHLLHAPLVGRVVEISEAPLADRILGIGSQDGIMVATPLRGDS